MKELLISLFLAFISAITLLAYKHPKAYRELYGSIFSGVSAGVIFGFGAYVGNLVTIKKMLAFVPPDKVSDASKGFEGLDHYILMTLVGWIIFSMYLLLLRLLPLFLEKDEKEKRPKNP